MSATVHPKTAPEGMSLARRLCSALDDHGIDATVKVLWDQKTSIKLARVDADRLARIMAGAA